MTGGHDEAPDFFDTAFQGDEPQRSILAYLRDLTEE